MTARLSNAKPLIPIVALVAAAVVPCMVAAQDLAIYPSRGQSQQQQDRDRYECHNWSVGQTGFDPTRPPPPGAAAPPPTASAGRGLLGGAAIGAIGGAIGGNAGLGAAVGAGSGALIGGVRRQNQQQQAQAVQEQQASALAAQSDNYNRWLKTCLQGRGYTVN